MLFVLLAITSHSSTQQAEGIGSALLRLSLIMLLLLRHHCNSSVLSPRLGAVLSVEPMVLTESVAATSVDGASGIAQSELR